MSAEPKCREADSVAPTDKLQITYYPRSNAAKPTMALLLCFSVCA